MLADLEIDEDDVWEALEAMPHYSPPPTVTAEKRALWQATNEGEASTSTSTLASSSSQGCSPRSHTSTRSQPEIGTLATEILVEALSSDIDSDDLSTREFGAIVSMGSGTSIGGDTTIADVITTLSRPTHDNSYVGLFLRTRQNSGKLDVGNPREAWDLPSAGDVDGCLAEGSPSSTFHPARLEVPETPDLPNRQVFRSEFETTSVAYLDELQRDVLLLGDSFPSSSSPGRVGRARRCRSQARNVQSPPPPGRDTSLPAHARHWSSSLRSRFAHRQRSTAQATRSLGHHRRRASREADEEIGDEGLRDYLLSVLRAVEEAPTLHAAARPPEVGQAPQACEVEATMQTLDTFIASENLLDACVICLEEMGPSQIIARLGCRHCFHLTCIGCWLPASLTCPLCKQPAARL